MFNQIVDLLQMVGWQTAVLFLVVFFIGLHWIHQPGNLPPGPTGWPVVGCALNVKKGQTHIAFTKWSKQFGEVFSVRLGAKLFIVLNDLRSIKKALHEQADVFSDRFVPHSVKLFMGAKGSFIFENGPIWKERRRFGLGALRSFGMGKKSIEHSINEESRYLLDGFAGQEGKPFDPAHLVNNAASNIICKICFGYRFNYSDLKFAKLIGSIRERLSQNSLTSTTNVFKWAAYTPLINQSKTHSQMLMDFVRGIVQDHHKTYDENNIRDIIDMGITEVKQSESKDKHGGRYDKDIFSDGALVRSIIDLFIAGTDTTTNTLLWALMYMAIHPDMQKKVQSEIDDVIGGSRQPLLADTPNMAYTNAVLLEVQRMRPVAPLAVPHQTKEETMLDGYTIPKQTCVLVNIWAVHHDPATWTEPEKFNPARFLSADGKSVVQHKSLIPFGTGRRACLGENLAKTKLFLFFVNILQQFTVTFPAGKPIPSQDGSAGIVLSPGPYELCVTGRS